MAATDEKPTDVGVKALCFWAMYPSNRSWCSHISDHWSVPRSPTAILITPSHVLERTSTRPLDSWWVARSWMEPVAGFRAGFMLCIRGRTWTDRPEELSQPQTKIRYCSQRAVPLTSLALTTYSMRDIGDDLTDVRKEVLSRSSSFWRKEREGSAAGGDSTGRRFCSQLLTFRMAINKILIHIRILHSPFVPLIWPQFELKHPKRHESESPKALPSCGDRRWDCRAHYVPLPPESRYRSRCFGGALPGCSSSWGKHWILAPWNENPRPAGLRKRRAASEWSYGRKSLSYAWRKSFVEHDTVGLYPSEVASHIRMQNMESWRTR